MKNRKNTIFSLVLIINDFNGACNKKYLKKTFTFCYNER